MLSEMKAKKLTSLKLFEKENPSMPIKYTDADWDFNNQFKLRLSNDQNRFAERLTKETERAILETNERTRSWKKEVEHQLHERKDEVDFIRKELKEKRKAATLEDETLAHYKNRLVNALELLERSATICQKCLLLREGRLGVDLCSDEVDRQLQRELKTITGSRAVLEKTLKETTERIRSLRAMIFNMDEDIHQKEKALRIDEKNLNLKDFYSNLGSGQDPSRNYCSISLEEWQKFSANNIENNYKEIYLASEWRAYIDVILKQVYEDLLNQTERTNEAFRIRIRESKETKKCLEDKHSDCIKLINDVYKSIGELETQLSDRHRSIALCKARLTNRSYRVNVELTCDMAQEALRNELSALQCTFAKLEQKLSENKATMRHLLHAQIMQEEEINIKTNTIKIDEVDCMVLRETHTYKTF